MPDETNLSSEYDAALQEALGEEPRSVELRRMQALLRQRHAHLARDLDEADDPNQRKRLEKQLDALDEQIRVLGEEAEINGFVEDTVRLGVQMRESQEG